MILTKALYITLAACWGSFLNVIGHRLLTQQSLLFPFSHCPSCKTVLRWYDVIPVISWIVLRGQCRTCSAPISLLYPFIELLSACVFPLLWYQVPYHYFVAYFIFFSALIVTIRTDLEHMLISRFVTTFLIPIGIGASYFGFLPITLIMSIGGTTVGYFFLFFVAKLFTWFTNKEGMGAGDFDLLAMIGSFSGPLGVWLTLFIGSTLGSLVGIFCIGVLKKDRSFKIPFGPFLAGGAMLYVLYAPYILAWLQI